MTRAPFGARTWRVSASSRYSGRMRRVVTVVLVTVLLGACGANENAQGVGRNEAAGVDPNARPIRAREVQSTWASAAEPEGTPLDLAPPAARDLFVDEQVVITPAIPAEERPRSLGDELRAGIGDVSSCLDVQTAARLRGSWSVSVSATALPSGRLQRASVSGSSLPTAVQWCIRDRVEAVTLAQPIEGAPRSVSTTLRYEVSAEVTTETRTRFADDEAPPGNTQAPGVTLPALAPSGPAPGAVAPAYVQPALAPRAGPAPGSVPPAVTLPALSPPVSQ